MKVYSAPGEIPIPVLSFDFEKYEAEADRYLAGVQQWARENSQPHALVGEIVTAPAADGQAIYVIAKFDRNLSLLHIETWDGWRSPMLEELGNTAYPTTLVAQRKARAELDAKYAERRALATS